MVRKMRVIMRGPPTIRAAREVAHADVGQSVSLVCEATAVPRIKGFQWSFQGRELGVPSQKRYTGQKAKLVVCGT